MTDHQKNKTIEMRTAGCGYSEIAKALSVSRDTIKTFCRRNNVSVCSVGNSTEEEIEGICPECKKPIIQIPGRKPRRFCSPECRQKWWNAHPERVGRKAIYKYVCPSCGSSFTAYGNIHRKYCSHDCYVKARFKGGENRD